MFSAAFKKLSSIWDRFYARLIDFFLIFNKFFWRITFCQIVIFIINVTQTARILNLMSIWLRMKTELLFMPNQKIFFINFFLDYFSCFALVCFFADKNKDGLKINLVFFFLYKNWSYLNWGRWGLDSEFRWVERDFSSCYH